MESQQLSQNSPNSQHPTAMQCAFLDLTHDHNGPVKGSYCYYHIFNYVLFRRLYLLVKNASKNEKKKRT